MRNFMTSDERPEIEAWFVARVPEDWFATVPRTIVDREEILVMGELPDVDPAEHGEAGGLEAARGARIEQFREATRDARIALAQEAEVRFSRKVAWGASCGGVRRLFTGLSIPVMTRLRLPERSVLDILVASGAARSRSDALAWCVRLVADNQEEWLKDLRGAIEQVERLRRGGPIVH